MGDEKNCKTCHWSTSENRMWCNNCERNSFIKQFPLADNFDFWQLKDMKRLTVGHQATEPPRT